MADDPTPVSSKGGGRSRFMPIVIVAILMIGEGIGIFYLANLLSPDPAAAVAADLDAAARANEKDGVQGDLAEVEIAECRSANKMSGKLITVKLHVSALVHRDDVERAIKLVEERQGRLRDRINFVIRSIEIKHFNEPDLQTIKRRLKNEFDHVFEDATLVREVLITEMAQSSSGV